MSQKGDRAVDRAPFAALKWVRQTPDGSATRPDGKRTPSAIAVARSRSCPAAARAPRAATRHGCAAEHRDELAASYFGHGLLLGTRCGQLTARQGCRGRYRRSLAQARNVLNRVGTSASQPGKAVLGPRRARHDPALGRKVNFLGQHRRSGKFGLGFRGAAKLDAVDHEPAPLSCACSPASLLGSSKLTWLSRRIDAWACAPCSWHVHGAHASTAIIIAADIDAPLGRALIKIAIETATGAMSALAHFADSSRTSHEVR